MLMPSTAAELASIGVALESAACALCGASAATPVLVARDRTCGVPGNYQVVRCNECGLLRTDPRPTRDTIRRYYPPEYVAYHRQVNTSPRPASGWRDRRVAVMPPTAPPGRLLEVGTSFGAFLHQCKRAGWDVTGVEFDERAASRAAELTGARIHAASIDSVEFPPGTFDVICSWQVVEHLHDPVKTLRRCFEWLAPGGWLTIAVPDAGSLDFRLFGAAWYPLQVPRHLYHFSPTTCRAMFESAGFTDLRLVRPRTVYTALLSVTGILEERGVVPPGGGPAILGTLPMRVLNGAAGYIAAPLGLTGTFTMLGRRPV